jgi:glucose/arabinose dehydrogenase
MLAGAASALIAAFVLAVPAAATAAPRLAKVGDFVQPVHVTGAPGDYERLYVVEQRGTIQVVRGGRAQQFLDLSSVVQSGGEEGLLSMALPLDFAQSRLFYVYFTDTAGNNRVEELRAPTNDAADPASRRLVILLEHPVESDHNGGQLQFGRDGMLYLAPGDGGSSNDPGNDAQRLDSELGKILRINPHRSGASPYTVPPDNPFAGGPVPEIWSYGLRNPFRFSFDRLTGDLTVGDVGEGTTEEIDFVPASAGAGRAVNFGWSPCEGGYASASTSAPCPLTGARAPVINAFHSDGWTAIIGGYVVRDPSLPSLLGRYVYSDVNKGELWSARLAVPSAQDVRRSGPDVPAASSFGEDAAGCLYIAQLTGVVSRIVENDARIPCPATAGADTTAPTLSTRVRRRQRVLRLRGAVAYARCSEQCAVAAGGTLRIRKRRYAMRRAVVHSTQSGRRRRIEVRLTKRGRRALRRALKRGRKPSVQLNLRARDAAGNRSPLARRGVRVRR